MTPGQDYVSRLKEEVHQKVSLHVAAFERELREFQNRLAASIAELDEKLDSSRDLEMPDAELLLQDALADANQRSHQELTFLADFGQDMGQKETQEEILNLLLDGAHQYAPRAALFVARGEQFAGWASRGYSEASEQRIKQSSFSRSESPLLRQALESHMLVSFDDLAGEFTLREIVGDEFSFPWHAFPMRAMHRPVAVLLAAPDEARSCDLKALSIIMNLTGLSIENMALKILQEVAAGNRAGLPREKHVPDPKDEASCMSETVRSAAEGLVEPGVSSKPEAESTVGACEQAPEDSAGPVSTSTAAAIAAAPPTTPASDPKGLEDASLETLRKVLQASETAIPATDSHSWSGGPSAIVKKELSGDLIREISDDDKLHSDAKRFARLLVSEIKLYNEKRVFEGRENRDLYVRLKRDIERSREMYEKRVPSSILRKIDYFHDELIRILGENDSSKLGSDYPGPRVES